MKMAQREESNESSDSLSPESLKLYEAQFFGFTPQTCMIRVNSAFLDCLYEMLVVVESVLVRKASPGGDPPEDLQLETRECTKKLLGFLQERFRKLSGRMESLLVPSVLSVPENVLLPEDEPHRSHPQSHQRLLRLEASIAELQTSYQAEVCARQALLAELEEQRDTQQRLDEVLRWVQELQRSWRHEGMGDIQESFRHMIQTAKQIQSVTGKITKKSSSLNEA